MKQFNKSAAVLIKFLAKIAWSVAEGCGELLDKQQYMFALEYC